MLCYCCNLPIADPLRFEGGCQLATGMGSLRSNGLFGTAGPTG